MNQEKLNILLVDDQPAKLLSYEAILGDLGENLIKAQSAKQALEQLLKQDVAILLIDVCMPDLDGFQLATMIREHPRFQRTAIIFISAVLLSEVDHLRGYELGAVDYVPVPVVPEVLRAKVRVFSELYRKTRELEKLNVPRSWSFPPCGFLQANSAGASRLPQARWDPGNGWSRPIQSPGTRASTASSEWTRDRSRRA